MTESIRFCAMLEFERLDAEHSRFGVRCVAVALALFVPLPVTSLFLLLLALPVPVARQTRRAVRT